MFNIDFCNCSSIKLLLLTCIRSVFYFQCMRVILVVLQCSLLKVCVCLFASLFIYLCLCMCIFDHRNQLCYYVCICLYRLMWLCSLGSLWLEVKQIVTQAIFIQNTLIDPPKLYPKFGQNRTTEKKNEHM